MTVTFIWLMVALKIPIAALLYLVHWAIKQTPETAEEPEGGSRPPLDPRPRSPLPRSPRRGAHGDPAPSSPPRVRSVTARGRTLSS